MLNFLKKAKQLVPPILSNFMIKNLGYIGMAPWQYMKEGFSYKPKSNGWNLDSIAKLQFDKWPSYLKRIKSNHTIGINHESNEADGNDAFAHNLLMSFAYVISLSAINKKTVNFLDWGGGIGHYGALGEELLSSANVQLNNYCYDFGVFNTYGKQVNPSYNYFDSADQFHDIKFDLVMASSSIWYEIDWKQGIDKLCAYDTEYLYITRMIFIEHKPSFVAIQRPKNIGYDTEYLFWIINENEFEDYLTKKGFSLLRKFEFGQAIPIFKAPEQGLMKGFLFKKK